MLQATAAVMRGRRRVSFFRPRTVGPCRPALPPSRPRRTPLNPHSMDQTLSTGSLLPGEFANRRSPLYILLFLDPSEYEILQIHVVV